MDAARDERRIELERTIPFGSLEDGSYHIVALVDAHGTSLAPETRYLTNEAFVEGWFNIDDGGGSLTPVFDPSAFPPGIAPVPGPHRRKGTPYASETAASAAYDVGSDGDDDVYVKVL